MLRSLVVSISVLAVLGGVAACKPRGGVVADLSKQDVNSPDGADPAISDGALPHEGTDRVDLTASGSESGDFANVPVMPQFSPQDGRGKARLKFVDDKEGIYGIDAQIDPAIAAFDPALALELAQEYAQATSNFAASAEEDKAFAEEQRAKGEEVWWAGYSYDSAYTATAQVGDVISIVRTLSVFTGGAHPNHDQGGLVMYRGGDTPVKIGHFVADKAGFAARIKKGLVDEKIARGYDPAERSTIEGEVNDILAGDDGWMDNYVLDASDQKGKFGGITVLFSHYQVGSYAEGAYDIQVPASELAAFLKAEKKALFGGTPPRSVE
jgi:hypothetical protein